MSAHGYVALAVALALSIAGCTDERLIGARALRPAATCEPQCSSSELCHPQLGLCVECIEDVDCERSASGSLCDPDTNACRGCDAGETCPPSLCDDDDDSDEPGEPPDEDDDCDLDERDGAADDDALPDL